MNKLENLERKHKEMGEEIAKLKEEQKDYTVVPASIAEYSDANFWLRNVFGNNNQFMYVNETGFNINHCDSWFSSPSVKLIKVNSITDIRVGDLVRFTDDDNWAEENNEKDYELCVVTKIKNDVENGIITTQYWDSDGCGAKIWRFDDWKNWQVSRPL